MSAECPVLVQSRRRRGWFVLWRRKDLRKMNIWMAMLWRAIKRSLVNWERESFFLNVCSIFEMRSYWISSVTIESCLYIGWDMMNWRIQLAFVNRVPSNQFNRRTRERRNIRTVLCRWVEDIILWPGEQDRENLVDRWWFHWEMVEMWGFHNERRIFLLDLSHPRHSETE
jgi:hypothetical protein